MLPPRETRPPIRILSRELGELQVDILSGALPIFNGSVDQFAIFSLLVNQHLRADPGDERPTSVLAIASSLSRPFETVRRNVKKLESAGFCRIRSTGVVLAPEILGRPDIASLASHSHDCLVRFVENMVTLGAITDFQAAPLVYDPAVGLRAASDLMLGVADTNRSMHAAFADLVIFSAVLALNYRTITTTPELAQGIRNESHPVPSTLLRGARPSIVARTMGLPETTVRRRMTAMTGNALTLAPGGYFVSEDWLNSDAAVMVSRNSFARARRIFGDLAAAGFPFHDIRSVYSGDGPPPHRRFD